MQSLNKDRGKDMAWKVRRDGGHFHRDNNPFELLVSDTLSMQVGKDGVYVDMYESQNVSGNALRKAATGKSTCAALMKWWRG